MEEGKDYIVEKKFVIFMNVYSILGMDYPQIIGICDTEQIAEAIVEELKKDEDLKTKRIYTVAIINGVKTQETKLKMSKIRGWIQNKFFTRKAKNE